MAAWSWEEEGSIPSHRGLRMNVFLVVVVIVVSVIVVVVACRFAICSPGALLVALDVCVAVDAVEVQRDREGERESEGDGDWRGRRCNSGERERERPSDANRASSGARQYCPFLFLIIVMYETNTVLYDLNFLGNPFFQICMACPP